jgi:enoyl-CoA hydratase/carnithine racemase
MDFILTGRTDGVLRIEFNRPEKKNAITGFPTGGTMSLTPAIFQSLRIRIRMRVAL